MNDNKKVWLLGPSGQLGSSILRMAQDEYPGLEVASISRAEMDAINEDKISTFIKKFNPDIVLNCIAYTNVDQAEKDTEDAIYANVTIPHLICSSIGDRPFIHISTDHVFGGGSCPRRKPYQEKDEPRPANEYGRTKMMGERAVKGATEKAYILRTAWLYSPVSWGRKNFYKTIRENALKRKPLKVVTDEVSTPTSVLTLSRVILQIVRDYGSDQQLPFGTYHITDLGEASRYAFAQAIVDLLPDEYHQEVAECRQSDITLPAQRPHYSRLATDKIVQYYPDLFRPWQERLEEVANFDNKIV